MNSSKRNRSRNTVDTHLLGCYSLTNYIWTNKMTETKRRLYISNIYTVLKARPSNPCAKLKRTNESLLAHWRTHRKNNRPVRNQTHMTMESNKQQQISFSDIKTIMIQTSCTRVSSIHDFPAITAAKILLLPHRAPGSPM